MQSVSFPRRPTRTRYRHELRTLTYVTLDGGNGGIVRNLSHEGMAVQAVARLRPEQRVRVRFELKFPRLRVEAHGTVTWSSSSGQCGIRFADLPARTRHQIDEWIFSNLLDSLAREAARPRSIFGPSVVPITAGEQDGLILSAESRPAIRLEPTFVVRRGEDATLHDRENYFADAGHMPAEYLNWLSRPLSARTLAWMVDALVVVAGLLLFAVVFLSIAHELPRWQLTLGAAVAAALFVCTTYWTLFAVFGGTSLGVRLTRNGSNVEEKECEGRFR
jgi:hypothetical protein